MPLQDSVGTIPVVWHFVLLQDSVHSSLSPAAHFSSSPQGWEGQPHSEWTSHLPDRNSYHGSIGELSASSMSSLVQPLSSEQMMSVVQLEHYLNNLMVSHVFINKI